MSTLGRPLFVFATLAAPLLAAALTLTGPPLSYLALAVPVAYLALLVVGVMSPRLGMFAPTLCHGPSSRPEVGLTFDDGPDPTTTPKILTMLAKANAHATFFVLGAKARQAPEILRDIAGGGHDIGVHGDSHDRLLSLRDPRAIATSLQRALSAVESVTGRRPTLFRPPVGHVSPRTATTARRLALTLVAWSVRSRDGLASTTAEQTTRRVIAGLRPGAIVLMHDAAEHGDREPASIAALPVILDEIARRGLRCVTLSRLVRIMNARRRARSIVTTAILWAYFIGAFVVGYWLVFAIAGLLRGRRGLAWGLGSYSRGFFGLLGLLIPRVRLEVPDRRELRRTRGAVVVCNHISFLDPLLLISLLPDAITIVRPDFFRVPIFGWLLHGAGFLGPDLFAEGQPWVDRVARHLRAGGNLLIFPEGTRSRDGKLAPFKKGAFYLARLLAAPILVLRVRGTDHLFAPGRLTFDAAASQPVEVRQPALISTTEAAGETSHELTQQVRRLYEID